MRKLSVLLTGPAISLVAVACSEPGSPDAKTGAVAIRADASFGNHSSDRLCRYNLALSSSAIEDPQATAEVTIFEDRIRVKLRDALPQTLYTVWVDFKSRGTGQLASDYPLAQGALPRGVAPAFASTDPVFAGLGFDLNAIVTDRDGGGDLDRDLDYNLFQPGDSPVVGGELAMQGENRVGGYWLRKYPVDPSVAPSLQLVDASGLPQLERSTPAGITMVRHPDLVTHGHTPGVGGVDHFSAFKGDFPSTCPED